MWALYGALTSWMSTFLGPKLVVASNTLQYSWNTERSTSGSTRDNVKLGQFVPDFSGSVRVTVELKGSGTVSPLVTLQGVTGNGTNSIGNVGKLFSIAYIDLPIGTSTINVADSSSLFTGPTAASYTSFTSDINVIAGQPVIFILVASGSTAITYARNLRVYFDELSGTAVLS